MSEDQGNPKRWYKNQRIIIQWLFVLLVLCVIATIIVLGANGQYMHDGQGYRSTEDELKNAVAQYTTDHDGAFPILNSTYSNADCSDCSVINISALLITNGGLLGRAPDGLNLSASGNDNCGGNTSLGCSTDASYIWIVDSYGSVYSYCAGAGCTTNNSGYQDVWP